MYPDSETAHPIGSFQYPVPPIDSEPDETPLELPRINAQWMKYLRGAAKQLLLQTTWLTDNPEELALAQQRAFNLIGQLQGHVPNWEPVIGSGSFIQSSAFQRGMGLAGAFYLWTALANNSSMTFRDVDTHDQVGGVVNVCKFVNTFGEDTGSLVVVETDGTTHTYNPLGFGVDVIADLGGPFELKSWTLAALDVDQYVAINLKNDWTWHV